VGPWRAISTSAERRKVDITHGANPLGICMQRGDMVGDECFSELEVVHTSIVRR
jgi:hypothetical protein